MGTKMQLIQNVNSSRIELVQMRKDFFDKILATKKEIFLCDYATLHEVVSAHPTLPLMLYFNDEKRRFSEYNRIKQEPGKRRGKFNF